MPDPVDPDSDPTPGLTDLDDVQLDVPPLLDTTRWWLLAFVALSMFLRVMVPLIASIGH